MLTNAVKNNLDEKLDADSFFYYIYKQNTEELVVVNFLP